MCDRGDIYHNPREGIGRKALNYGGVPIEFMLHKMEETDMGTDDYAKHLDDTELEVDKYRRDVITDRSRTEPLMNADEEPTRNYVENSGVLNVRFNEHRGTIDPQPQHGDMFMGFMDVNPNGSDHQAPRMDTETARMHTTVRARNSTMNLHDSSIDRVPETEWQPAQISEAKKDMQRWFQNIYNQWQLPSFVNFGVAHTAANKLQDDINKKLIMDEYKQHMDETGPDVMDQYGRILSNNVGYTWYTAPNVEQTMDFQLESTVQPRAIISANDPTAKGLYYADATFNSEESTSRIPPMQHRFPGVYHSRVDNTTTHATGESVVNKQSSTSKEHGDTTKAKHNTQTSAHTTDSTTTRAQKVAIPTGDQIKSNFNSTSKFSDPLFNGALTYTQGNRNVDKRSNQNKAEATTEHGIENTRMNDRRSRSRQTNISKFGVQEYTQESNDNLMQQNVRGQARRTNISNFDNKEFGELHDTVVTRNEGRGRGMFSEQVSRASGISEGTTEMYDSIDPMMRGHSMNGDWAHKGRVNGAYTNIDETLDNIDSNERTMGLSARSFDPYAHARNLNKYDVVNLDERF